MMRKIERLRELHEKATKGPWEKYVAWIHGSVAYKCGAGPKYMAAIAGDRLTKEEREKVQIADIDAELIAHMRNLLPDLLELVDWAEDFSGYIDEIDPLHKILSKLRGE